MLRAALLLVLNGQSQLYADSEVLTPPRETSTHWAFRVPEFIAPPPIENLAWPRTPIDHFILSRLEAEGIAPSPEASRRALIRRLSFDLLGLPPLPEEVEAFAQDARPDAWERLVDRFLASPHFGEQWGRHWLDLARYGDSDGYEKDNARPMAYVFRDWVINSINSDLPFDQFSIEQLAGDLLPDPTPEQLIATGFHRNTLTNGEGGADPEEFRCRAVVDRVNTTASVWLGLTMACAQCHSHKTDPISQREYYQFYSFFNNAREVDVALHRPDELRRWEQEQQDIIARVAHLEEQINEYTAATLTPRVNALPVPQTPRIVWDALTAKSTATTNGSILQFTHEDNIIVSGRIPATETLTVVSTPQYPRLRSIRLEVIGREGRDRTAGRGHRGEFLLTDFAVEVLSADGKRCPVPLGRAQASYAEIGHGIEDAIDGLDETGWSIWPRVHERNVAIFEFASPLILAPGESVSVRLDHQGGDGRILRQFRLSYSNSPLPASVDAFSDVVADALYTPPTQRSAKHQQILLKYVSGSDPHVRQLRDQIRRWHELAPPQPTQALPTMSESPRPGPTHIHIRGDFLRKGPVVQPATPSVLHSLRPEKAQATRMDLARWLFDPANPLTARVTVNRVWQRLFDRGLVPTSDDFGLQGEAPSHPELLDWLALEFQRMGWSRKALVRLIVTSATYRQSSDIRSDLADRDPLNILMARQTRWRLNAENVRDAHLRVSGLLNSRIGGRSFRPYLPRDILAVGFNNPLELPEDFEPTTLRRSIYIFSQRTVPFPMLSTFDAPDSSETCVRRERSNSPLQALTLLNDPMFVRSARALALRLLDSKADLPDQITKLFETCLSRPPEPEEIERLMNLHALCREHLATGMIREILDLPRLRNADCSAREAVAASLVILCRTVMNLDEFISRE